MRSLPKFLPLPLEMVTKGFGNRNFMQPRGRLSMHSKCLVFFSPFKLWVRGRGRGDFFQFSFVPNMFPSSSQWVFIMFPTFPMCSSKMFPIARPLNPICFAQSPPLLTYICGPNGEPLHLSIKSSILGSLDSFNLFLQWANQNGLLPNKKVGV